MADTSIQQGPAEIKEKELRRDFPVEEGLNFGLQRQEGNVSNLVVQEKSLVAEVEKVGF